MKRLASLSLGIGIANPLIAGVCIALFMSPLGTRSGPMPAALMVPFFYCLLSFIPAAIGIVIGLVEVFRKDSKTPSVVGLCLNTAYLVVFFTLVASMWGAWMSV